MDEHSAILLQDFVQHVRTFKFQTKKIKKQFYINWVDHGAKWYMRFWVKKALHNFH